MLLSLVQSFRIEQESAVRGVQRQSVHMARSQALLRLRECILEHRFGLVGVSVRGKCLGCIVGDQQRQRMAGAQRTATGLQCLLS